MDVEQPSTARMIDYWLGGEHHFPVDVAAAAAFEAAYGPVAEEFRRLRAFLGRVVRRMAATGLEDFLALGAGVPTMGNVHECVPSARVLYVDLDPVNVALGQEILDGHPTAAYTSGDATDLTSLDPAVLQAVLPGWGRRPTGVVVLGLAAFIDDAALSAAFERIHRATVAGSLLAVDFDTEVLARHPQALALMGPTFRMRAPDAFAPLLGPWTVTDEGLTPVDRWGLPAADNGADNGAGDGADAGGEPAAFYGGLAAHGG